MEPPRHFQGVGDFFTHRVIVNRNPTFVPHHEFADVRWTSPPFPEPIPVKSSPFLIVGELRRSAMAVCAGRPVRTARSAAMASGVCGRRGCIEW
jgi:hypothetical protein